MYAGHFAVALGMKATQPRVPTWTLLLGTGLLDLAFGVLYVFGLEGAEPDHARSHLLVIPWTHSLLGAVLLAAAFAMLLRTRAPGAATLLFAVVLSHWLLDVMIHAPDMRWWPGPGPAFGYRQLFGGVSGWLETGLVLAGLGFYAFRARASEDFGRHWGWVCAVVGGLWALGLAA